ncbi:cation channel sperm-associated targeting subunit tau isoform X3 [Notamacropus eugenii]|uniref:cation channel sperm-associated targeting subunit tau isoform X3 n=1 Tax=Notamacropus eugenii TaxID=9315 RepID=UPI003B684B09
MPMATVIRSPRGRGWREGSGRARKGPRASPFPAGPGSSSWQPRPLLATLLPPREHAPPRACAVPGTTRSPSFPRPAPLHEFSSKVWPEAPRSVEGAGVGVGGWGYRMEPSQTEKKVSELSESQRNKVHSLFKVPFLHKGGAGAEDYDESRNMDDISQSSSLRHSTSSRIDPTREGSKEGAGRKLLNVGCLAVHIKRCRHFSPRINLQYYTNLFIRITINKIMKCTKAHSVNFKSNEKKPAVKFDEVKYFSVQVPRRQDDERNMIYLELMEFDDLEAYPILLGSFNLHLYEIIQKGCFTEEFYMKIRNLVVCKVEVEFMFSYGNFGYGFSHQLKPLQKLIQPSMFMHIPPPVERTDPLTNVITPQLIEYPAFLSPDLNVTVGTQPKQAQSSSPVRLEKLQQQPRDRLDRMKKEYRNLKTWEEKSNYLDKILHMKTEEKEFPDSQGDNDGSEETVMKSETQLPSSSLQPTEFSFKEQEDKPPPSELPVQTPEVKKSLSLVEMKAEPPDSSLIIQEDAETKDESLPPEESTPLCPISLKEKDICVESVDGRDDKLVRENTEPEGETLEEEITDSTSAEVKPRQSYTGSERMDSIQSETKLKSIILSPDRRKKSIDESGVETKKQILRLENRRSSELLQDLKEDTDAATKVSSIPRHVSFNISHETIELPSNADVLKKDEIEGYISLDEDKDKDEGKEKYKEGVGEKHEIDEEENEIVIRNTYGEDYSFREAHPESMPLYQGCQKTIIIKREKFEPFLRNITEIPIEEDDKRIQNMSVCTVLKKDTSSAEIIEHEDQDPPYAPASSNLTENSEDFSWDSNPDIFTIKSLDTEEMERGLSSLSLESFEGESTFTIDIDLVGKGQENLLSELLDLNPSLEKLEKTVVLKSILNDDLKDLSEELFSKQRFLMETEVEKKGQSSLETDTLEKAQNEIKVAQSEQIELSGKKSSSTKSSKKDLKIVQNEQLSELSGKKSSSLKCFKNDLKIVQSEQVNELSRKRSSSLKSSKSDIKNVQNEQLSGFSGKKSSASKSSFKLDLKSVQSENIVLSGKTSSGLKSSQNDLKIVQSEHIELSGKTSSSSKSSKNNLKVVQSEHLVELSGKASSGSKSSKSDLKIVQSEQLGELSGKTSASSKSSLKTSLKSVQSEQIELSGKTSSGLKSSKKDLKIVQSEHSEISGKASSSSKSSKNDLRIVQSEHIELSGKTSARSKSSKSDLKVVQSEHIELSGKTSASSKSSKSDLKIVQSEQLGELSEKTSASSKSSKTDLKIVQSEQLGELSEKTSASSKSSKSDLKIVQSEQLGELSEKTSASSKSSKSDLKIVQSEQLGELSEKTSASSKSSKSDLKIVQSEQLGELSEKTSASSKSSKSDLKIVQSEQLGELSEKTSASSKSSKSDLNIVQIEQLDELSEKTSASSKSSKSDLKIAQSEQLDELSEKTSASSKSSKSDLKIAQSEQLSELSEKTSASSKSSKSDLKIAQSEQLSELSEKTSASSKSSKSDLKIVEIEQLGELSEKTSASSKSSKSDLKIVQSEQLGELSEKTSASSKSSKSDLKIVEIEQLGELSEKTSASSKSSKSDLKIELSGKTSGSSESLEKDLKIVQSEQIELLGKTSSGSKNDLKIVQSEELNELSGMASVDSKSSQNDLKIVQSEQLDELSAQTSLGSKSSQNDLKIVQSEQIELSRKISSGSKSSSENDLKIVEVNEPLGKTSSGLKSSQNDVKIVQSEQLDELLGKMSSSSKSSKIDLKIVQSEQLEVSENAQNKEIELSENVNLSSKSSENDIKILQNEQIELSENTNNTSSKSSSENDLKIVQSEQSELSRKKSLSSKSFSKEVLKCNRTESQILELTEEVEVEECHISQTFDEPEEQLSIEEGDLTSGRKHSFKKKHPEEYFQKNSEELVHSISVLSVAESFESPEDVALIEQISSEPQITELDLEHSVSLLDFPESSLTVWDSGLASTSQEPNEKHSGVDLSKSKSFVRHIFLQTFPSDSLDSGIVGVIELDKEDYQSTWLEKETSSPEERPTMMEEGWKLSLKNSKKQFPQAKEEDLPQRDQLYREKSYEEKDLDSVLENASAYIMHKLSDSEKTRLKSFVSNVFNTLSTENITELGLASGAEVEKENQTFSVPEGENEFEELDANSIISMEKSDDTNVKPVASPKRSSFEEYLSRSEAGHLNGDLSKHIQNFLVERLSGQFPKEDLPKILEDLYLIDDKKESPTSVKTEIPPKEQNNSKDFRETSPKSMPSVSNSNQPSFDDKHLEIRLRALLSEILQQYILSNYTETKLIRERESENRNQNLPPYRTKTVPPFSHEVRHDYPERSFSGESELHRRGLLSQSILDLLTVISESELLNLKSDLSKRLQSIFIERLSNMGLITEREFHTIHENLSLINSSDRALRFLSSDLRGLSQFLERPSEKQSYKTFPRNKSQEVIDERLSNIELARKLEREYFTLHNIKRRSSLVREDERQYSRERVGKHGLTGVKASRKSSQEFLFNNSSERIKLVLRREQKLPQVEKTGFEEEIQDSHGWYNRPKTSHSKATLKIKPLGKKEHINIYKVTVKEKPEPIAIPCVQNSEIQSEMKEYFYKSRLPSSSNTYAYLNSDDEEESNLKEQYHGKSKENSKKKPLLTVTQFQKELQAVYVKPKETSTEKCATTPQSFDHSRIVEINNSKPSIFPEVLKTESLKPKLRREREYVEKQKRPLYRTAKILAASQPATRLLLKKSPQRTLLFPWAGKRNTHDSSEHKKEDFHLTSFKHLEKAKAKARFDLGKSPDNNQYTLKDLARPNTAPEFNKRLKENFGKLTSPRVVSAGLFHVNVTNPGLEEYHHKKDLKDLEKCSIICDILQLLNSSYVKRKYEDDY